MTGKKPLPTGIHEGISDVDYHADKTSLSSSGARTLARPGGPAKFKSQQEAPEADTTAFRFGRAAHAVLVQGVPLGDDGIAVLPDEKTTVTIINPDPCPEDEDPEEWYAPKKAKMTKTAASKTARGWAAHHGHHTFVTQDEAALLEDMRAALLEHPKAAELLNAPGRAEVSVITNHPVTGIRVKARPDYWLDEPGEDGRTIIVDYKTTDDASPAGFARSARMYGYDQAAAWYRMVLDLADAGTEARMIFIAQEKTPPYLVAVYELTEEDLDAAAEKNEIAIGRYEAGLRFDLWPGYGDGEVQPLPLTWAPRKGNNA